MKKYFLFFAGTFSVLLLSVILIPSSALAAPTFTAAESISNVAQSTIPAITFSGGITEQKASQTLTVATAVASSSNGTAPASIKLGSCTATFATTTLGKWPAGGSTAVDDLNCADYAAKIYLATSSTEVKASQTLTVVTPVASSTAGTAPKNIIIGSCTVSFATTTLGNTKWPTTETPALDDLNCSDGGATIFLATTSSDIALSIDQLGQELRGLINVIATTTGAHGALQTSGTAGTNVAAFTATTTEMTASNITFTDGTGGAIANVAVTSVPGTDVALTVNQLAQELRGLINVIATTTAHGALQASGTAGTNVATFTATTTETTASNILFTDGTSDEITNVAVPSIVAVGATASTVVPAGLSANVADQSITIDGKTIALGSSVLTAAKVADDIVYQSFLGGDSYSVNGAYTVSTTSPFTTTVNFARSTTTGALGNVGLTLGDAGYGKRAQVVTFTPANPTSAYDFNIFINGTKYTYAGGTVATIVNGLNNLLASDTNVTCTTDNAAVTCTEVTPGTALTSYDATVTNAPSGSSGGGSGGGGGSTVVSRSATPAPTLTAVVSSVPVVTAPSVSTVSSPATFSFSRTLSQGASGDDVTALQTVLTAEGVFTGPITGYFGPITAQAVKDYQAKYGINQVGVVGPMTLAQLNSGTNTISPATNPAANTNVSQQISLIRAQIQTIMSMIQQLQAQIK